MGVLSSQVSKKEKKIKTKKPTQSENTIVEKRKKQ